MSMVIKNAFWIIPNLFFFFCQKHLNTDPSITIVVPLDFKRGAKTTQESKTLLTRGRVSPVWEDFPRRRCPGPVTALPRHSGGEASKIYISAHTHTHTNCRAFARWRQSDPSSFLLPKPPSLFPIIRRTVFFLVVSLLIYEHWKIGAY